MTKTLRFLALVGSIIGAQAWSLTHPPMESSFVIIQRKFARWRSSVCLIVRTIDVFSAAHPHVRADTVVTRSMERMDRLAVLPTGIASAIDFLSAFTKNDGG